MRPVQGTQLWFTALCSVVLVSLSLGQELEKQVIVIGGGMSGLSAARRITSEGRGRFTVRVFEARRERYGGRVWTDRLKNPKARGLEVDLGAFALNVGSPFTNPLLNLTRDLELETATLSDPQFIMPSTNKKYSGDQLHRAFVAATSILKDAVNRSQSDGGDISVRTAVDRELKERGVDALHPHSLLLHSLSSYIIPDYSARLYQPYALDFGFERVLLDGMGELLDRLASGREDESPLKISLRTAVRQIKVDRSQDKVVLRLKDGSQVTADEVVVAVPAQIITRGDLLFEPGLPKHYMTAMSHMGITSSNKVIVEFDAAFWPPNHGVFVRGEEKEEEEGCLQKWINVHKLLGVPVLVGLFSGQHATKMEGLSDSDLHHLVLKKLQATFGETLVSSKNILRIRRSGWMSDPLSGGGASYPPVGSSGEMWDALSEPWCPHVYFAGEYTLFRHHGTLHGAYISGQRAADQILSGYCERKAEEERKRKEEEKRKAEMAETDQADTEGQTDQEQDTDPQRAGTQTDDVRDEL